VTYPGATYVVLHDLQQNGYDVLLGADVFARARITIDFGKSEVTFAPPAAGASGGLPIGFEDFVPIVATSLNGKSVSVAVDTGAAGTIGLGSDFSDRHPEFPKGSATVRLGAYEIEGAALDAAEKMPYDGRIGGALLSHFTVTFDYGRSTMSLSPRANDATAHSATRE
jgi:hypothetical protein